MTETGNVVKIGETELFEHSDTLNFTVPSADKIKPEQAAMAGNKESVTFSFPQVSNDEEANAVCANKEWSLVEFVNDALRSAARSNAYQTRLALYRPSEVSADDIRERMIRDYVRLGVSEEMARAQVESLLAAK